MVPIVSVKIEPRFLLDTTTSNLGLNTAALGFGNLIVQLQLAASAIRSKLADPALPAGERATLDALLARIQIMEPELQALLTDPATAAYFLPTASSAVGTALRNEVQRLRTDLLAAGITAFSATLNLPTGRASADDFGTFVTDPAGPIAGQPIDDTPYLIRLGDIEVGAAVALIDKYPTTRLGRGIRATVDATVRLRTGQLDRPDRFLDLGTGDRQPDVDLNLTTDIALGRLGVRMAGGYNLQLPGNQNRRVTPYDQPLAPVTTTAGVRRDPGDMVRVSVRPFFRLATYLSLYGAVDYWSRKADTFSYAAGQSPIEGVDLEVLARGTRTDALLLSGGISYSHAGESKLGLMRLPLDASLRYERILRSQTGILPDASTVRVDLRLYTRLWN
jgi:Arc/MetJ family transcription regulator